MRFLTRLQEALILRGIRKGELARLLDVSPGTVSEWFTQGLLPTSETMLQLPSALRVDGHWLLTGQGTADTVERAPNEFVNQGARLAMLELHQTIDLMVAELDRTKKLMLSRYPNTREATAPVAASPEDLAKLADEQATHRPAPKHKRQNRRRKES